MVSDVTKAERDAEAFKQGGPLPTARLQGSFGLHVVVTMGTFYALMYYGSKEYLGADETKVRALVLDYDVRIGLHVCSFMGRTGQR